MTRRLVLTAAAFVLAWTPQGPAALSAETAPDPDGMLSISADGGSSEPTYYASNHRMAVTAAGRQLVVFGRHGSGVALAWRDPGGAWQRVTRGAVLDGTLLNSTGTGDWTASIAVARDLTGQEHAWVVWSGANFKTARPLAMRRLTGLEEGGGPWVGPVVTIEAAALGEARADVAFETTADGTNRGALVWTRRTASATWQVAAAWFTALDTETPAIQGTTLLFSSSSSENLVASLVPGPSGVRAVARSGGVLRVYGHDAISPLTSWWGSVSGVLINAGARPTGVVLESGEVLATAHDAGATTTVVVQRFGARGETAAVDLTLTGYVAPTLVSSGPTVWLVMVRQSDGFVVSREFTAAAGWTLTDHIELGPEGGGSYSWPNVLRDVRGYLRFIVRGPGAATRSSILAYQRRTEQPAMVLPTNVALPTISGSPEVNASLTASPGTWNGTEPISYEYAWSRCDSTLEMCESVVDAVGTSYPVQPEDLGVRIRMSVTASNAAGSATAHSEATPPVIFIPPADLDGVTNVVDELTGSSDPTYFAGNHRMAVTAGGRQLVTFGLSGRGVGLAWRDPGGAWQRVTRGAVLDGTLLDSTGTGDWTTSVAVARDLTGQEHAWVVWSGANFKTARPLAMRRLTGLEEGGGPWVGPVVAIEAAALGEARADVAFETTADGTNRGALVWTRRTASATWQVAAAWFTALDTETPAIQGTTLLFSSSSSENLVASLVPGPSGVRAVARSGGVLRVYGHDAISPLTSWWGSVSGVLINAAAKPTGVVLESGEVLATAHDAGATTTVVVQRFGARGETAAVDLTLTGYVAPTLVSSGPTVWLVMVRQSDGFVVSREFTAAAGWTLTDHIELGPEGGGSYSWPNVLRDVRGYLRFIVRGPGAATRSSVLAYQRQLF